MISDHGISMLLTDPIPCERIRFSVRSGLPSKQ